MTQATRPGEGTVPSDQKPTPDRLPTTRQSIAATGAAASPRPTNEEPP